MPRKKKDKKKQTHKRKKKKSKKRSKRVENLNNHQMNIYDESLKTCSTNPMTGWFRDGYCNTDDNDEGTHTVCAELTDEFLKYTKLSKLYAYGSYYYLLLKIFNFKDLNFKLMLSYFIFYPYNLTKKIIKLFKKK